MYYGLQSTCSYICCCGYIIRDWKISHSGCSGHPSGGDGLKSRVMKVEGSYVILPGEDTLIYQPYMPAVGGYRPFTGKRDALEVGKQECRKLAGGESPALGRVGVLPCLVCDDK